MFTEVSKISYNNQTIRVYKDQKGNIRFNTEDYLKANEKTAREVFPSGDEQETIPLPFAIGQANPSLAEYLRELYKNSRTDNYFSA